MSDLKIYAQNLESAAFVFLIVPFCVVRRKA